jgi:hypothetical protein
MRHFPLFIFLFLGCACGASAQSYPPAGCFADRADNPPFKKKLWQGYEVSLGPVRDGEAEEKCTAAIYRADGKVVYRTTGFSVVFDAKYTGLDFDGDGQPEVVFRTDTGGGMHCCWAYNIISLSPKPLHLFDINGAEGTVRFDKDKQARLAIWQNTAGPYGFTSMARTPGAQKVLQVRAGKLTDITPEYSSVLFSEQNEDFREWNRLLTKENLEKLRKTGESDWNNEDTVSALLSKATQHLFCRQFEQALQVLDLWPESSRVKMKQDFAAAIKADYPEFAARLAASH